MAENTQLDIEGLSNAETIMQVAVLPSNIISAMIDSVDSGGYYKTFRNTITHDFIGEGLPSAAGFFVDIGQGIGESAWDLVTEGDFTNPFKNIGRADGFTAEWGRWGSENWGQPLAELYDSGEVDFRLAEGDEKGGVGGYMVATDGNNYNPVNGLMATVKIGANIPDIAVPALAINKLGKLGTIASGLQKAGMGAAVGGMGGMGLEYFDKGDSYRLLKLMNDPDELSSERDIRLFQRRLNDVNVGVINQSIESLETQKREVREGKITGDDALDIEGAESLSFLDDDGILNDATSDAMYTASDLITLRDKLAIEAQNVKSHYKMDPLKAYDQVLQMEEKFYQLASDYIENPETFDPSQQEILSMQLWLMGETGYEMDNIGLEAKEETLELLTEHLDRITKKWQPEVAESDPRVVGDPDGISSQINTKGDFNSSVEVASPTVSDFIAHRQSELAIEHGAINQKLDDFYQQQIQQMQHGYTLAP